MPEYISISPQVQSSLSVFESQKTIPAADSLRSESTEKLIPKILKTPVQFKLSVGAPDDPLEDEADAMADKVMRMPEQNFIQRKCAHCEEEEKVQRKPLTSFIQKKQASVQQSIEGKDALDEESKLQIFGNVQQHIQRSTKWVGATVNETLNLAEVLAGTANEPVTWQTLNGTPLEIEADADSAINLPTILTSGSGTDWKAKVDKVPLQEGGDNETVLAPGPWSTDAPKDDVGRAIGLAVCSGADNSTFTAHGKPSDDAVFKANRRHENHHVADDKTIFENTIKIWDKKVQKAKDKGKEFKGVSAAAAEAALWTAMDSTPKEIARKFRSQSFTKGDAFHHTPRGKKMKPSNSKANPDCSISSIDITNPS